MNQTHFQIKLNGILKPIVIAVFALSACKSRPQNIDSQNESIFSTPDVFPVDFTAALPQEKSARDEIISKLKCDPVRSEDLPSKSKLFDHVEMLRRTKGMEFIVVRSDLAPFCLPFKNTQTQWPVPFDGIWWMNGNPVPEALLTFANASWVAEPGKSFAMRQADPLNWSWFASHINKDLNPLRNTELWGIKNHLKNMKTKFTFHYGSSEPIKIDATGAINFPKFIMDYTMINPELSEVTDEKLLGSATFEDPSTQGPDMLVRHTSLLGGLVKADYRLTRIIDEKGMPILNNYNQYLKFVKRIGLVYQVIYKCKLSDSSGNCEVK